MLRALASVTLLAVVCPPTSEPRPDGSVTVAPDETVAPVPPPTDQAPAKVLVEPAPPQCGGPSDAEVRYSAAVHEHKIVVARLQEKLNRHTQMWILPPDARHCRKVVRDVVQEPESSEPPRASWRAYTKWTRDAAGGTRNRSYRTISFADRLTAEGAVFESVSPQGVGIGRAAGSNDLEIHGRLAHFDRVAIYYDESAIAYLTPRCVDLSPELFDGTVCPCEANVVLVLQAQNEGGHTYGYGHRRAVVARVSERSADGTVTIVSGQVCPTCEPAGQSCEQKRRCMSERLGEWTPQIPDRKRSRPLAFWTREACRAEATKRR